MTLNDLEHFVSVCLCIYFWSQPRMKIDAHNRDKNVGE